MDQRLNQESEQELRTQAQGVSQRRNFEQPEEVIRADREQVVVPEALAGKLAGAIAAEPPPAPGKPWWKRIFG